MRKSIFIQRDFLLDGYRSAICFQQKHFKKMTSQLLHTIEVFEELRRSEEEIFEVIYELGEGV